MEIFELCVLVCIISFVLCVQGYYVFLLVARMYFDFKSEKEASIITEK